MSRIEKLLEYIKQNGKDSFLQHALALEYIKIDRDEEARNVFNELLLREPTYVGSYYHLGKLLERAGNFEKAIKIYEHLFFMASSLCHSLVRQIFIELLSKRIL